MQPYESKRGAGVKVLALEKKRRSYMNELKILLAERERRLKIKRLTLRRSCKKERLEMKIPLDSLEENILLA